MYISYDKLYCMRYSLIIIYSNVCHREKKKQSEDVEMKRKKRRAGWGESGRNQSRYGINSFV